MAPANDTGHCADASAVAASDAATARLDRRAGCMEVLRRSDARKGGWKRESKGRPATPSSSGAIPTPGEKRRGAFRLLVRRDPRGENAAAAARRITGSPRHAHASAPAATDRPRRFVHVAGSDAVGIA